MTNTLRPAGQIAERLSDGNQDKYQRAYNHIIQDRIHAYTLLREQLVKKRRFFRDMGSTNFNQGIDEAISILDTVFNKTETK